MEVLADCGEVNLDWDLGRLQGGTAPDPAQLKDVWGLHGAKGMSVSTKVLSGGFRRVGCRSPSSKDDLLARIDGVDLVAVPEFGTRGYDPRSLHNGNEAAHGGTRQDLEVRTAEGGEKVRLQRNYYV